MSFFAVLESDDEEETPQIVPTQQKAAGTTLNLNLSS